PVVPEHDVRCRRVADALEAHGRRARTRFVDDGDAVAVCELYDPDLLAGSGRRGERVKEQIDCGVDIDMRDRVDVGARVICQVAATRSRVRRAIACELPDLGTGNGGR